MSEILYVTAPEAEALLDNHPGEYLVWYKGQRVHCIMASSKYKHVYRLYENNGCDDEFAHVGEYDLLEVEAITDDELRRRCHELVGKLGGGDLLDAYDDLRCEWEWHTELELRAERQSQARQQPEDGA